MNCDDEIDNVNQGSDIEIGGDSSEESGDDAVHQNVHYKFMDSIKSWWIYFPHEVIVFSQPMGAKHPLLKETEPVE